jgi:hypothetical protein
MADVELSTLGSVIKTAYEAESDTNAFTDAEKTALAGAVLESDYNAHTILQATTDNTPVALTVAEQTLVGRITAGNITALTTAQVRTLLNVVDGATNKPVEHISFALSDETTALTTGLKLTYRMPYAFTLTDIKASVTTAPTDASLIADVHEGTSGGTSIMTTNKLVIETTEFTTKDATTQPTLTDTSLADDAELTFYIDQIGSTIAGAGLKVTLIGTRT